MDKRKIFLIGSVIIIIVLVLIIGYRFIGNTQNVEKPNESNVSSGEIVEPIEKPTVHIEEEKTFEALTFSNIRIVEKSENENILKAIVTNNSEDRFDSKVIDVELFRKNGTKIGIIGCLIPDIETKASVEIEIPIAANVMNTTNVTMKQSGN